MATTTLRAVRNPPLGRIALSILLLIGAISASAIVALSNSLWFDILHSFVGATDAVTRGLLSSSWLLVIGEQADAFLRLMKDEIVPATYATAGGEQ